MMTAAATLWTMTCGGWAAAAGAPPQAAAGMLRMRRIEPSPREVDLTQAGTRDWMSCAAPHVCDRRRRRRAGSPDGLLRITLPANAQPGRGATTVRWTDGTLEERGRTRSAIRSATGFTVSAPAGRAARTLTLLVGADHGEGAIIAHLTDGSAPDITDISLTNVDGAVYGAYILTYRSAAAAASAGPRLIVTWKSTGAYSGEHAAVVLQAVTLR